MKNGEAIYRIKEHMRVHKMGQYPHVLIKEALDMAIEALLEQENWQWVPVTEPPQKKGCYFVTVNHYLDGKPVTREAYWNGVDWHDCYRRTEITPRVTHWMLLPEPAKEDKNAEMQ